MSSRWKTAYREACRTVRPPPGLEAEPPPVPGSAVANAMLDPQRRAWLERIRAAMQRKLP